MEALVSMRQTMPHKGPQARLFLWKSLTTLMLAFLLVILAILPTAVDSAKVSLTAADTGCFEGTNDGQDLCQIFNLADDVDDDDCYISSEVNFDDLWNMDLDDEVLGPTMVTIIKRASPVTDSSSMATSKNDPSESSVPAPRTSDPGPSDIMTDASPVSAMPTAASPASPSATAATNTTAPATTSASESGVNASTAPTEAPTDTSTPTAATSSAAAPTESAIKSASVVIPLAVGVSVGGTSLMLGVLVGAWFWRRRRNKSFATAESPPPRDIPDNLETVAINGGGNGGAGAGVGGGDGGLSRQGSVLSSLSQYPGYSNNRFGPESVAMHDVPRAPSAGPERQWKNMQGTTRTPEIPYDGRRFPPYYGIPPVELPG